jgi:peroxiredoxin
MTNLKNQTQAQVEKTRSVKPEFMKAIDDVIADARKFEQGGNAIAVGEEVPDFTLPNAKGEGVLLSQLLGSGPVIITFYRGSWCPYCNLQLRAMQSRLDEIHALGAELVAISPEIPDESLTKTEIDGMSFPVLSDQDAKVAEKFGVAWEVPDVILEHMRKDRNLDLADINNGNGSTLPIPATFIIDRDGVVQWRFVEVDYRVRAEPDDIIEVLSRLDLKEANLLLDILS